MPKTLSKRIEYITDRVDIVDYINSVVPLEKHGSGLVGLCPFHADTKPSFHIKPSKQYCRCFTCMDRSVGLIDFVIKYNNIELVPAVELLEEYIGGGEVAPVAQLIQAKKEPLPKNIKAIKQKMYKSTYALMQNHRKHEIFSYYELETSRGTELRVNVSPIFQKLLEHKFFIINEDIQKRFEYLKKTVAYDSFFNSSAIILRDSNSKVVDIVKYRPNKPKSWDTFTSRKYYYLKDADKLDNRGENFLYPFSVEIDRLIKKHKFLIIGEGLKNAVVALFFGVPFVSIESSSTNITTALKEYVQSKAAKGYKILGGFDGDTLTEHENLMKGEGAYERAKEELGLDFNNLFLFNSNIDFADYLAKENDLRNFENKFDQLFFKYLS